MSKAWTTILLAVVMVVQTLAIISDAMPSHLGDSHHDTQHTHFSIDADHSATPDPSSEAAGEVPDVSDHCQSNHCHGSHLLVVMRSFDGPLFKPGPPHSTHLTQHPTDYINPLLRPPIA